MKLGDHKEMAAGHSTLNGQSCSGKPPGTLLCLLEFKDYKTRFAGQEQTGCLPTSQSSPDSMCFGNPVPRWS